MTSEYSRPIFRAAEEDENERIRILTQIARSADKCFEKIGGSSRHWVRDCFLPCAEKEGWRIILKRIDT